MEFFKCFITYLEEAISSLINANLLIILLKVRISTSKLHHHIIEPHSVAVSPSKKEADFEARDLKTSHNVV